MDRSYHLLREDLPSLQRLPSEYVREHFWFTTQPIDEPEKPEYFLQTLELLDMNDRLLFATDYPHWDFDAPDRVYPRSVPDELKQMMYYQNALRTFSKLPNQDIATRPMRSCAEHPRASVDRLRRPSHISARERAAPISGVALA
jgi:hypothetical protein